MTDHHLWLGTYTGGEPRDGIYHLSFDGKNLSVLESWGGLNDPSYLQPVGNKIYAVEELPQGGSIIELRPGVPPLAPSRQRLLPHHRHWKVPLRLRLLRRLPCGLRPR